MTRTRYRPLLTFTLTFALLMLAIAQTADAATITVINTADSGIGSLRQALADAASGDTIDFDLDGCPCTITLTSGDLVIDKNVTISGPGAQVLAVSGNQTFSVFTIAHNVVAEIAGLRVSGGGEDIGAGILVLNASLTLRNVVVSENFGSHGGGISSEGTLIVIDSTFANNHASVTGGAINQSSGTLTLTNTHFTLNTAGAGGGAINSYGTVRITQGSITGNSAPEGGALQVQFSSQMTLVGSTITGNRATEGSGGGIWTKGTLSIIDSTISGNASVEEGGAVFSDAQSTLTVVNSTISSNTTSAPSNAPGGGVFVTSATVTIMSSTIVQNERGGLLSFGGVGALSNTIVAGNGRDTLGALDTANNNLIGGDVALILNTALAINGGSTATHALVANSPAIGAGSTAWLPADQLDLDNDGDTSEPIPFDQRGLGFPRIVGTTVDIGAVEAACPVMTIAPLPNGTVGAAYSQTLTTTGGKSPHAFSAASLPPGLMLSSDGVLSGTPTTAGSFTISVTVVEDGGCASTIQLTLTVVEDTTCGIGVGPATLQTPYIATLYYQPISASPSGQYTYSVSSGALPPGLYLFSAGQSGFIGGFPTTPGTYTFSIKAKKKNSACESTRTYTVTVPATVAPQLTCVVKTGNKQYTARFGYDNSTGAAVTIPVGTDNYFTPGNQNRGQVTVFRPGRVTNAFSVTFTVSGNKSDLAIWFVKGPDGVKRPVNITTATFPCQ